MIKSVLIESSLRGKFTKYQLYLLYRVRKFKNLIKSPKFQHKLREAKLSISDVLGAL